MQKKRAETSRNRERDRKRNGKKDRENLINGGKNHFYIHTNTLNMQGNKI